MGRKTNEQRIQEQIDQALKVEDLKRILSKFPDDMPIGIVGHFGEALLCDEEPRTQNAYLTPGLWHHWKQKYIEILVIEMSDKGSDPD